MKFELKSEKEIIILDNEGKEVGHIFTPAGSREDSINAIQICGFSEAFDFWGCGIYKGFKDIQLLFDGKKMKGEDDWKSWGSDGCLRCFRKPCGCEIKEPTLPTGIELSESKLERIDLEQFRNSNPFIVKREHMLKERIIKKK